MAAGRQLRHRDLPDAGRREARRPRADRRAVPGLRRRHAGDHAERAARAPAVQARVRGRTSREPRPRRLDGRDGGVTERLRARPRTRPGATSLRRGSRHPRDRRARRRQTGSPATTGSAPTTGSSGRRRRRRRPRCSPTIRTWASAMPSVWFMNGLHCRALSDAARSTSSGVTFPGVPGVVLGHNAPIAWGATNVDPDVQDLFRDSPTRPTRTHTSYAGRVDPVRRPTRDDQGRRRRDRRARRPLDRATGRSSTTSTTGWRTRPLAGAPLDGNRRRRRHVRGDLPPRHGGELRRVPGRVHDVRRARPRTSSTPTSTATSATSCRAASRSAPTRPTTATASVRAATAARVDRHDPVRRPAVAARSRRAG